MPGAAALAASAASWGAVYPTSEIFGSTLHRTQRCREVALTFDDGPNPAITPQLLALLERHSIPASFFLVGRFARACPELVREIAARGHTVGNHTETHRNLALLPGARIEEELTRGEESIAAALGTGHAPEWMRPPFGYRGPQLPGAVRRAGLRGVVMWSLMCYDWRGQGASRLIKCLGPVERRGHLDAIFKHGLRRGWERCSGQAASDAAESARRVAPTPDAGAHHEHDGRHGGEVVLLHDGDFRALGADQRHVLVALEYWLPRWKDAGLEFVTIDQVADTLPASI